jgi:lysozyme
MKVRKGVFIVVAALAVCIVAGVGLYMHRHKSRRIFRPAISRSYDGIDVSHHQGRINWEKVAQNSNIQFVYIKASEGATRVDKRYSENIQGARRAGIKVGSYHFFRGNKSAKEQFSNFNKYINKGYQDLIPMVDVEENGNSNITRKELQNNLREFMQLIKDEYGKYPLLYSQYKFYKSMLSPEFDRYYLFIARYGNRPPHLEGNTKYNIWQFSERGRIDGINGYVDLDCFDNGTTLKNIELQ